MPCWVSDGGEAFSSLPEALASLGEEQLVFWDRDVVDLSYSPTRLWVYRPDGYWAVPGRVTAVAAHERVPYVRHVWCWRHDDARWMLYCEHTRSPVGDACGCVCNWCQSARGSQDVFP